MYSKSSRMLSSSSTTSIRGAASFISGFFFALIGYGPASAGRRQLKLNVVHLTLQDLCRHPARFPANRIS
jgi:hypothetical protein